MAAITDPAAILAKFPAAVPRYTSYPTAPHFQAELGASLLPRMLASVSPGERVSLYLHIPFCDKLCWFCGCHTKQVLRYGPVADYVGSLVGEIGLVAAAIANFTSRLVANVDSTMIWWCPRNATTPRAADSDNTTDASTSSTVTTER